MFANLSSSAEVESACDDHAAGGNVGCNSASSGGGITEVSARVQQNPSQERKREKTITCIALTKASLNLRGVEGDSSSGAAAASGSYSGGQRPPLSPPAVVRDVPPRSHSGQMSANTRISNRHSPETSHWEKNALCRTAAGGPKHAIIRSLCQACRQGNATTVRHCLAVAPQAVNCMDSAVSICIHLFFTQCTFCAIAGNATARKRGSIAVIRTGSTQSQISRATPLHLAAAAGHASICKDLMQVGADPSCTNAVSRDLALSPTTRIIDEKATQLQATPCTDGKHALAAGCIARVLPKPLGHSCVHTTLVH